MSNENEPQQQPIETQVERPLDTQPEEFERAEEKRKEDQENRDKREKLTDTERKAAEEKIDKAIAQGGDDKKPEAPKTEEKVKGFLENMTSKAQSGFEWANTKIQAYMPTMDSISKTFARFMEMYNSMRNKFMFAAAPALLQFKMFGAPDQKVEIYAQIKNTDPALKFLTESKDDTEARKLMSLKTKIDPATTNELYIDQVIERARQAGPDQEWTMDKLVKLMIPLVPKPAPAVAPKAAPVAPSAQPPPAAPTGPIVSAPSVPPAAPTAQTAGTKTENPSQKTS